MKTHFHSALSNNNIYSIINSIPEAVIVLKMKDVNAFQIVEANKQAETLTEYSRNELVKMSPYDLVDENYLSRVSLDFHSIVESNMCEFESLQVTKRGRTFPSMVKAQRLPLSDDHHYIINIIYDITCKRKTEDLLEQTNKELISLFDYNPDIIFMMNREGYFTNANPALEQLLGYKKSEFLNMHFLDIVYPEDIDSVKQYFRQVIHNDTVQVESRVLDKNKQIVSINVTAVPIHKNDHITGVIGIARDITNEKEMSKQLQENEQRYRSIFDHNVDMVLTLDLEGNFIDVNKATEELMGYQAKELTGTHFLPYIVPELHDFTINEYKKVGNGTAIQYETCIFNRKKERVYLHVTVIPIIIDGEVTGVHCIGKDISEKKIFEEKLNYMAYHDYATGLPNQHFFYEEMEQIIKRAKQNDSMFALFFLDLNRFKAINDSLGHNMGDLLLKKLAKRLSSFSSSKVTPFRYGGDEFTILLENTNLSLTTDIANQLKQTLSLPYQLNGIDIVVTPSIGVSLYPKDGIDCKTLIKKADNAMYYMKYRGTGSFQFYEDSLENTIRSDIELESHLRKAIKEKEFHIMYQPLIDAKNDQVFGAEALLRWNNKKYGPIPPTTFIPLAEESGLIVDIGEWVLEEACFQLVKWHKKGLTHLTVSINISIRQFYQTDFVPKIRQIIDKTGVNPESIKMEITESIAMNADTTIMILKELKNLGIQIAMDDFGTGYSSLNYLKRFPIDHLKIDQSFVQDISNSTDDQDIVSTIILLGKHLKKQLIAEGVETKEQVEFLKKHDCDILQGYYFSKPMEAGNFSNWVRDCEEKRQ
ncbi:EAL domain-containing protein [Gracilibacillus sp. YIM 98692]|uniref:sensor domain-containing protein n=1 Tax=Gracilibacillus sp. YIM 98692 TaxID=2663532 RepID=UPI001F094FC1|nr:EAL domain-containing protein [Gracilibacillus sp. YIM 98692]